MNVLRIGENISNLRKRKGINQETLANFLGVTKASISKWENNLSYPDVLLIPQIANYFDVSIDQLMGYQPQLTTKQIQNIYHKLASEFATNSFSETVKHCDEYIKQYYSCYPFLMQIGLLWINHFMLAPDEKTKETILDKTISLCEHILVECNDVEIQTQTILIKAIAMLQLGKANEVINLLTPLNDEKGIKSQIGELMIQAYQMAGKIDSAVLYNELEMYKNVLMLVTKSTMAIALEENENLKTKEIIYRTSELIRLYNVSKLNYNIVLVFYSQAAVFYSKQDDREQVLYYLKLFTEGMCQFIDSNFTIQTDEFFNHLSGWLKEQGTNELPRNSSVIIDSAIGLLQRPEFKKILSEKELQNMIEILQRKQGGYHNEKHQ